MFNNLVNHYLDKLTDMDRAVGQGAQLSMDDHQCVDLYAHELKNLLAASGMLGAEHSSRGRSYDDGRWHGDARPMSYDDGRSYGDIRGGSYNGMSRGSNMYGYSGDAVGDLVSATNRAMTTLPADMQQEARNFIDRLQRSQGMR